MQSEAKTSSTVEELPIEDFEWKKFTSFEAFLYKLHLLLNNLFCRLFNQHDWIILIESWNYNKIESIQEFQLHCARKLKCSCCGKIVHYKDAQLSRKQNSYYKFYTTNYFRYRY